MVAVQVEVKSTPVIGIFNTPCLGSWQSIYNTSSQIFSFANPHKRVPGLVVGFKALKMEKFRYARVKAHMSEIAADCFQIHIDSSNHTKILHACCSWLVIEADDLDFQWGTYSTIEDHNRGVCRIPNERKITFEHAY